MNGGVLETLGKISSHDLCHLHERLGGGINEGESFAVVVLYGSWNTGFDPEKAMNSIAKVSDYSITRTNLIVAYCLVDETEDSLTQCLGDNEATNSMGAVPPPELPAILVVAQDKKTKHVASEFVPGILPSKLFQLSVKGYLPQTRDTIYSVLHKATTVPIAPPSEHQSQETIRIFVSGDRSSVGKSSVCLGILGTLVAKHGYEPSSLAYIKPATQCEAPQLIQMYCEKVGIPCIPVGPVVYFKGFTRSFLAGETASSQDLLASGGEAVDEIARGKRLVMIDGVGFPSVGSICGTDNASMARACGYPSEGNDRTPVGVLLVGGPGVGSAVDAYNLNATYFRSRNVPVIGAIFNKLSLEGFYSLENCREQVTRYFDQQTSNSARPFGFVPLTPGIGSESAMDHMEEYIRVFGEHVDVKGIVEAAARCAPSASNTCKSTSNETRRPAKQVKLNGAAMARRPMLSREAIEAKAKQAGAAPSA